MRQSDAALPFDHQPTAPAPSRWKAAGPVFCNSRAMKLTISSKLWPARAEASGARPAEIAHRGADRAAILDTAPVGLAKPAATGTGCAGADPPPPLPLRNQRLGFIDENIRNRECQIRLGAVVVEHVALRHIRLAGDVGNAGCGESRCPEQPRRGCNDALRAFDRPFLPHSCLSDLVG
jgi:hypothetical protein